MKVNLSDVLEGCILRSDVFSKSEKPIMPKKTVLTPLHLEVLKAFNIQAIDVEEILNHGAPFHPSHRKRDAVEKETNDRSISTTHSEAIEDYLEAVTLFKEQFMNWQKGQAVAYLEMKTMLSPLIHTFIKDPKQALTLYHYCQQEEYLYHHSVSVALLSALLAKKLKYDSKAVLDIGFAGLLADAGLAKLPPRLLKKMTDLNDYDIKQFKQHPVFGYQMLKKDPRVHEGILLGVLQHHEKEDGSGYPLGIKGTQLHPYSKIIAVVDYFHAMICSRPHHPKYPLYKALESLKNDRFSKYDSRIVRCFFEDVLHVSIGTKVRLTNQEVGEIIYVDTNDPTRPILRMEGEQTLSLKDHKDLFIDDILSI